MNRISELIGPNGKKPPAIFWRNSAKQFMSYIGYHIATKGVRIRSRVRTAHYLGKDKREAILNAILIDRRWDQVCAKGRARHESILKSFGTDKYIELFDHARRPLPVWPPEELKSYRKREPEPVLSTAEILAIPCDDEYESERVITLAELCDRFLQAQKARIGLIGRRGLKENSYNFMKRSLHLALRGLDTRTNALTLTRDDCRKLIDYWSSPDRNVSPRTIGTYCKAFLQLIKWADAESVCGFRMPNVHGLFAFSNVRAENVPFDPAKMKSLMNAATDRCKLYLLLGLNTGYTQADIANLKLTEIIEESGQTFLVRRREKTSHQNDFRTKHILWPETAMLLKQQLAPENSCGLALLNVNGRPLLRGKTDNIRDSVIEVRDTAGVPDFSFKQLRKFGASAIHRLTMSQDIARLYAGHRIVGVLSHYVRDDFFDPLTDALQKWAVELRSICVLD